MKQKIIKALGGYTYKEYQDLQNKYEKALAVNSQYKAIQLCNETTQQNFRALERFTRSLYNTPLEEWARKMYNVIHNNYLHITIFYLGNKDRHTIYKFNPNLTSKEELVDDINNNFKN